MLLLHYLVSRLSRRGSWRSNDRSRGGDRCIGERLVLVHRTRRLGGAIYTLHSNLDYWQLDGGAVGPRDLDVGQSGRRKVGMQAVEDVVPQTLQLDEVVDGVAGGMGAAVGVGRERGRVGVESRVHQRCERGADPVQSALSHTLKLRREPSSGARGA